MLYRSKLGAMFAGHQEISINAAGMFYSPANAPRCAGSRLLLRGNAPTCAVCGARVDNPDHLLPAQTGCASCRDARSLVEWMRKREDQRKGGDDAE